MSIYVVRYHQENGISNDENCYFTDYREALEWAKNDSRDSEMRLEIDIYKVGDSSTSLKLKETQIIDESPWSCARENFREIEFLLQKVRNSLLGLPYEGTPRAGLACVVGEMQMAINRVKKERRLAIKENK